MLYYFAQQLFYSKCLLNCLHVVFRKSTSCYPRKKSYNTLIVGIINRSCSTGFDLITQCMVITLYRTVVLWIFGVIKVGCVLYARRRRIYKGFIRIVLFLSMFRIQNTYSNVALNTYQITC